MPEEPQTAVEIAAPITLEEFLENAGKITIANEEEDHSQGPSLVLLTGSDEKRQAFSDCLRRATENTLQGTHDILERLFTFEGVQSITLNKEGDDIGNKYKVDVYCEGRYISLKGKTLYDAHINALNGLRLSLNNRHRHI